MIDDDQLKPVAYTLDIVVNGNWAVQSDYENSVASKPPLYQWTCAILGILRGKVDELTMYLPTGLSILITVLLCSRIATERFGSIAGLWTGLSFLLCSLTAKHVCLARTDAMFTMWVSAAAFTGLRAWERGGTRQWTLFWVFAALATLTKGPLGLVIASLGLAAHFPERKETSGSHFRGSHLIGISLFILLCGGWFAWAVLVDGERVIDKMIGRELIGHAVASEAGHAPLTRPYQPLLYFLVRFAPWCVPALSGLYFAFRTPAADPAQRRLERFCACWLALGLIMFGIAGHQRADLLLPLFPAAAILAGRRLARWRIFSDRKLVPITVSTVIAVGLFGISLYNHRIRLEDREVKLSQAAEAVASTWKGDSASMIYTESGAFLQYWFGLKSLPVTISEAALALQSDPSRIVITADADQLLRECESLGIRVVVRDRHPLSGTDRYISAVARE
jgi:4-amino-4-deoxy-L-arabinose transferase-like glycosyltransferase